MPIHNGASRPYFAGLQYVPKCTKLIDSEHKDIKIILICYVFIINDRLVYCTKIKDDQL